MKIKIVQLVGGSKYDSYDEKSLATLIPLSDWEEVENDVYNDLYQWVRSQVDDYKLIIMDKLPLQEYCKKATDFIAERKKKVEDDKKKWAKQEAERKKEAEATKEARELKKLEALKKKYEKPQD